MVMTLPDSTYKLEGLSPRAFQHPADRAATAALQQVPYLDAVVRRLIELGYERALRQAMLGSAVRLGQQQLPRIWVLEREVFHVLDLEDVPDLYMTQFPLANALTFGSGRPVIVLNSEIVRLLDTEGLRVVIAHEAAHVLSDHVLYQTALYDPAPARRVDPAADLRGTAAVRHPQRAARVVARGGALAATAPPRW